jgi:hypothetical protein
VTPQVVGETIIASWKGLLMIKIDEHATKIPRESGLALCLYIPIAARDESAIRAYVGEVCEVVAPGTPNRALLVNVSRNLEIDMELPIWNLPEAAVLHCSRQLWVHVDYNGYRSAYMKAFSNEDLHNLVVDHILNRRVARLKGFMYLRVLPISREANSSSGGLSEKWAVRHHSSDEMRGKNLASRAQVQYADLADIVKMLNRKTGGLLQDPVNEAQVLVDKIV